MSPHRQLSSKARVLHVAVNDLSLSGEVWLRAES
jgi:hypothetical protein